MTKLPGVQVSTVCPELRRNQGPPETGTDKSGCAHETGNKSSKNDRRSDRWDLRKKPSGLKS